MSNEIEFLCILISALMAFSEANRINPYCLIRTCQLGSHTLCEFNNLEPSDSCHNIVRTGLEQLERDLIVDLHNDLRRFVYNGSEERSASGRLPKASFETFLEWDDELAEIAQRWAEQCIIGHDRCRHVDRFLLGQNYGYELIEGNPDIFPVDLIIAKWYLEVKKFKIDYLYVFDRNVAESNKFERFTQMVWHFSRKIGCGAMRFMDGLVGVFFLVCNYGPKGNYSGKPVYPISDKI